MRTAARVAVSTVTAALLAAGGYGAYNFYDALTGDGGGSSAAAAADGTTGSAKETGAPSQKEARQVLDLFLASWSKGDADGASALTNNAGAAGQAFTSYFHDAGVTSAAIKPGAFTGTTVSYAVDATVEVAGLTKHWRYSSKLTVVRGQTTGRALVDWQPSLLHPDLKAGEGFGSGATAADLRVTDRDGGVLDPAKHPVLKPILDQLASRYGSRPAADKSVEVWFTEGGSDTPGNTVLTLRKGKPATLHTTLDPAVQRAAEQAVSGRAGSGVVAVRPSTGEILAIADGTAGSRTAMQRNTAPGSTFKIITTAALLDTGRVTAGTKVPCPKTANYAQGKMFHNVEGFAIPGATLAQDFASSCNTAFVSLTGDLPEDGLRREARDVFGIGPEWQTGTSSYDGSVPGGTGDERTAEMIGQGQVQMSPLTMASVAATVRSGGFHQPYLVSPSLDHRALARAARPLSPSTASQLRSMMRLTAVSGTAAPAMRGLSGEIGAKTGSAEVDGQVKPDAWFTAYRNDVAAAAMVPSGGHGVDAAGPIVRAVLAAG